MEVLEKELNCFVALPIQTCTDSLPNLSSYFSSDGEVSTEDLLERLLAAWDTHPVHGKILFDAYSFDLWDLLHQRTFTSSSEEETSSFWELQIRFTRRLSQSVSAKEFKIMFLEKLHLQNWTYIGVRWYCYVCQLYLVGGNAVVKREDEDLQAVQGMLAIFNAFFQTEGEPQSRPFLVGLSFDILYMLHGVACLHTEWTDRISATDTICALKQTSSSLHQIVLQWLYTTAADFAVMYLDDDMHSRDVWCHEAVLLWQYLLDYQMQDVLCFHRQIKYQISVDLKAKTASFESSVDGIKQINKLQEMLQRDCGNHRNVANTVSKYLEANSASIQTEDVLVSTETLINLCSPEVHVLHSSSKQPVLGLVLLLQHWLFYALYSSASSTSSFSYSPLGLHRSLLEESYQEVLKCLLSINKLAAKEGLRALVCLCK